MANAALSGIKVLELCEMAAGPYCTKLMADLGAEVIKVEKPDTGDEARHRGPFLNDEPNPEQSGLFLYLNTNKLGITLNLENARGRKIFKELVKETHVLVEDKAPGKLAELGLGYDVLKEINPSLIMASITPFGQTGPYKDYKAYPLNTFHSCGEGYVTPGQNNFPDYPPLKVGRYVGEYEAAIVASVAIMGAVYHQMESGEGQYIDVSKQEALVTMGVMELTRYPNTGEIPTRGTRGYTVGGFMPCKDGFVEFCLYSQRDWEGLVDLMGTPEWTKDEKFKDQASRAANCTELQQNITNWLMQNDKEYIYQGGQKRKVPVGAYYTPKDLVNSEHIKHRGFFAEIDHPKMGRLTVPTAPYNLTKTPWHGERGAPLLGEHNEEIYQKRLGYSQQDLVRMRALKTI
ncbi:CaiB/BaiF CoA transferase family protein [Chloroflexota bacterium]